MPIRTVLVDDDPEFIVLFKEILDLDGRFRVVGSAGTVPDARSVVADRRPRLVISDLVAGLDDLSLLHELTSDPEAPTVVVLSSHVRADAETRVREAGAEAFLEKLDLVNLPQRLLELVEGN